MAENVIAVTFEDDSKAYQALSELKNLHSREIIKLSAAAVAVRGANGHLDVKEEASEEELLPTATGGLVGLLIGILGGPLGVLIGGASGLLAGAIIEADTDQTSESVLAEFSRSARVDHEMLLAELSEPDPGEVDRAMAQLGGKVLRERVDTVEAEIATAEHAQHEAKKKARKELREKRETERKEDAHAKVQALKAKLHGHHDSSPANGHASGGEGQKETAKTGAAA